MIQKTTPGKNFIRKDEVALFLVEWNIPNEKDGLKVHLELASAKINLGIHLGNPTQAKQYFDGLESNGFGKWIFIPDRNNENSGYVLFDYQVIRYSEENNAREIFTRGSMIVVKNDNWQKLPTKIWKEFSQSDFDRTEEFLGKLDFIKF